MGDPYYSLHGDAYQQFDSYSGETEILSSPYESFYQPYDGREIDHISYTSYETSLGGRTYDPSQLPTPSTSHSSTPINGDPAQEDTMVSVSTAFYPGAHAEDSDIVLASSDMVLFYVHSKMIVAACEKAFSSILPGRLSDEKYRDTVINVPDESVVLNVILHVLYNLSCAQNSPSIHTLVAAVNRMPFYNICPKKFVVPGAPLYMLLLAQAPLFPIDVYTVAAQFDLQDLAVNSSSHLLSYPLPSITDELAQQMGALYLKRLMCLQIGRNTALKNILLIPPPPHPPTKQCNFSDQRKLTRAWALVSAYLAWDARPDLSTSGMQRALSPLTDQLTCEECHRTLKDRIKDVVVQWASVKRTI